MNDEGVGGRYVQPRFDDGGGEQDVVAALVEGAHHVFQLRRGKLAVADDIFDLGHLLGEKLLDVRQVPQARGHIVGLTTPFERPITPQAERRLHVLQSLDSLGAGFQLASHDLDIRGGGNLLGDEQSGHIREIGVELYQQMLEDAVAELKANAKAVGAADVSLDRGWSPQINAGAAVLIPEAYVPDLNVRLALYRRLSEAERFDDREALAAELIDRFGPLPDEADHLLKVVAIKGLCREANVAKIDVGPKGAVVGFRADHFAHPTGLIAFVQRNGVVWRLRPDQKLVIKGEWETPGQRLVAAERILRELANLAKGPAAGPQCHPWAAPVPPPPPPPPPKRVVVKLRPGLRRR